MLSQSAITDPLRSHESANESAMWDRWLAEPPSVRSGANSFTWCTGTSAWSIGSSKRAAALMVGWTLRPWPTPPRKPLRRSSAGVSMAPAHTKTWSARIVSDSTLPSGLRRSHCAPATPPSLRGTSFDARVSGEIRAPAATACGIIVRDIDCFVAWPAS